MFDIKRSEVDGPILQFQSTIFEKEDIQKLVKTLNKACGENGLSDERLGKAFDVWYPTLENDLKAIKGQADETTEPDNGHHDDGSENQKILEEILELSRSNQKLIRNPDGSFGSQLEETRQTVREILARLDRPDAISAKRNRRFHPMMLEELMHSSALSSDNFIGLQMVLAVVRADFPWIYEAGMEVVRIFKSRASKEDKHTALREFYRILEFSFEHPMMREQFSSSKDMHMISRELPHILMRTFERALDG